MRDQDTAKLETAFGRVIVAALVVAVAFVVCVAVVLR